MTLMMKIEPITSIMRSKMRKNSQRRILSKKRSLRSFKSVEKETDCLVIQSSLLMTLLSIRTLQTLLTMPKICLWLNGKDHTKSPLKSQC
jgi:hypothetical protein